MTSISEQLKAAANDVEEANVPEGLRESAFVLAFWARHGSSSAGAVIDRSQTTPESPDQASDQSALVGEYLGLDPRYVEAVLDFSAEEIELIVSPRLFDSSNMAAAIEIAYLLAAARQACGEQWTDDATIRQVVQERGRYGTNFSRMYAQIDGNGASVKGEGRDRRVKLNAVGFERAAEIAQRLATATVSS